MADGATKFSVRELCREIIPVTLKPRAAEKYTYFGGEEQDNKKDVLNIIKRIGKGIERKIANKHHRHDNKNNSGGGRKRTGNGDGGGDKKKQNI